MKTVAVVLTDEGCEFLHPYIDVYINKKEKSGNHIHGESFEQIGSFLVITVTPAITGDKLENPMKLFIPVQCVKFAIEGVGASIGFGVSDTAQ